jgi:hypothetical protein
MHANTSLSQHELSYARVRTLSLVLLWACGGSACAAPQKPQRIVLAGPNEAYGVLPTAPSPPDDESHPVEAYAAQDQLALDEPNLPGDVPVATPDEQRESKVSCECGGPRPLLATDQLGGSSVAAIESRLSRAWRRGLTWTAGGWFRMRSASTEVDVRLSNLRAFERECVPHIEPVACGGGRYLEGTMAIHSADGLLSLSFPVRVDVEGTPRISYRAPLSPEWLARRARPDVHTLVFSLWPDSDGQGNLIAVAGDPRSPNSWAEHVLATW